ncbi:hypothetical protein, partial [Streptomyces benahoarensis]|uniref:hypothetical protein n=1 Tax=Streptomyces benahoarensis TaxID=2595054 RepID=UPI00163D7DEF
IRQAIQRADVEKHAHRVICQRFPKTLGCVVAAEMWRGYPSHPHGQPSAVAYLGANIYLRYCSDDDFGGASLLLPCAACGIRLTAALRDDHDLTVVLYAPDARTTCARCRSAHA